MTADGQVVTSRDRVGMQEGLGSGAGRQGRTHLGRARHVAARSGGDQRAQEAGCGLAFTAYRMAAPGKADLRW